VIFRAHVSLVALTALFTMVISHQIKAAEKVVLSAFESCPYVCSKQQQKGVLVDIVEAIFAASNIQVEAGTQWRHSGCDRHSTQASS
jgi:hypothetical protein